MADLLQNLTLRQLRSFVTTIKTGSLTIAADNLGVTQPAVSLQLQNLQALAGLALMQRTAEGLRATEAGEALLALAREISRAMSDCTQTLEAIKGISGGHISVGAVSTAKYFAPKVIGAYGRKYPKVELKLTIGNRAQIIAGLQDFSIDVAIMGRPPQDLDIEKRLIGDHPHFIVCAPDHPLAERKAIALADLADQAFLSRELGSGTRQLMEARIGQTGFVPRIIMEIDSNETIKQAVMAGFGIALISGHTISTEIADGRLKIIDIVDFPIVRQWFVVRRNDKNLLPPALSLVNFLAEETAQYLPLI